MLSRSYLLLDKPPICLQIACSQFWAKSHAETASNLKRWPTPSLPAFTPPSFSLTMMSPSPPRRSPPSLRFWHWIWNEFDETFQRGTNFETCFMQAAGVEVEPYWPGLFSKVRVDSTILHYNGSLHYPSYLSNVFWSDRLIDDVILEPFSKTD